jgi:2,4-dienoyl-CoA reductase-like NADH-dependent reductase (Old Yellow Enzyme family)
MLSDQRGAGRYLRVSWHPDTATVVLSHWVGAVCVASTPLHLAEAARMVGLIVGALQDTAAAATEPKPEPVRVSRVAALADLVERVRDRFRPRMAQIVELGERLRPHHQPHPEHSEHPERREQHDQL